MTFNSRFVTMFARISAPLAVAVAMAPAHAAQSAQATPRQTSARELRVVTPGFVYNAGIKDLAAAFTKATGIKVLVEAEGMRTIVDRVVRAEQVSDVVVLPLDLMSSLALDQGIVDGSFAPLGRVPIGLAVKKGAPHPDIATVAKLANVLKAGGTVLYSNPASGSMSARLIDNLLKRPEFSGVHGVVSREGEGGQALRRGEGDMALQLICEVYPYPEIELAGVLPRELGAYIDGAVAISARSTQRRNAARFIAYLLRPQSNAVWNAKGLYRFNSDNSGGKQ
jgi:molybdate transport system substrate-binding protein